jgi:general secretion pathway protein I
MTQRRGDVAKWREVSILMGYGLNEFRKPKHSSGNRLLLPFLGRKRHTLASLPRLRVSASFSWGILSGADGQLCKPTMVSPRQTGFTLLEVLVAVAVMAIALVGILKANYESLSALEMSRERTTAVLLAANKLAEVEAAGAGHWSQFQGDFGEDHAGFIWKVESTPTAAAGLVRVAVTVLTPEARTTVRLEEVMANQ